jgi:diaminohydroxyphosphoribosylaminopyrimidine deaminase / 5-amino-6-(5-phosphoribosylamino)uracil reductase
MGEGSSHGTGVSGVVRVFPAGVCLRGFLIVSLRFDSSLKETPRERRSPEATPAEEQAMHLAMRLARRGIGTTHPNPRVGAVLLLGGDVIATGYHKRAGEAHAEARALEEAGSRSRGATLVVTLEPCAHQGRTPPCAHAIVRAGVRRVVIGMRDPNPLVDGRGIELLRREGVDVVVGLLEGSCRALNPPYLKELATGLPWVTIKAMLSLDGRMASESGESRGLGGAAEQRLCHRLRAEHDAVLIGVGTLLADDPLLTVRLARGRTPLRIVLDSSLRAPLGSRLLESAGDSPVVIATLSRDSARTRAVEARGARVWTFDAAPDGRVPLRPLLAKMSEEGLYALLVEGGAAVHTSFLREGLADRVAIGIAPVILGGAAAPRFAGDLGRARLSDGIAVDALRTRRVGSDVWLEGEIRPNGGRDV